MSLIRTLPGIFPEPRLSVLETVPKRDFVMENIRHIKKMQVALQNTRSFEVQPPRRRPLLRQVSRKSRYAILDHKEMEAVPLSRSMVDSSVGVQTTQGRKGMEQHKKSDQGVQTETTKNLNKIYENGTIMYPSSYVSKTKEHPEPLRRIKPAQPNNLEPNDSFAMLRPTSDGITTHMENLVVSETSDEQEGIPKDDKDFMRRNIEALDRITHKKDDVKDPIRPPPGYQKGVVPKYIQERKEAGRNQAGDEHDCPEGHVLLPEDERKETLKVLRQSYADRIQELNSMPVRNDTLRMRRRKMELDNELKKIDEGIKVFQRPKVFVKIDA